MLVLKVVGGKLNGVAEGGGGGEPHLVGLALPHSRDDRREDHVDLQGGEHLILDLSHLLTDVAHGLKRGLPCPQGPRQVGRGLNVLLEGGDQGGPFLADEVNGGYLCHHHGCSVPHI